LQTHLDLVRALFLAAYLADEPFPQVLSHALERCYRDCGWDPVISAPRRAGRSPPLPPAGRPPADGARDRRRHRLQQGDLRQRPWLHRRAHQLVDPRWSQHARTRQGRLGPTRWDKGNVRATSPSSECPRLAPRATLALRQARQSTTTSAHSRVTLSEPPWV
jgi:hypothetical protein